MNPYRMVHQNDFDSWRARAVQKMKPSLLLDHNSVIKATNRNKVYSGITNRTTELTLIDQTTWRAIFWVELLIAYPN